jgi:hypothetical protein
MFGLDTFSQTPYSALPLYLISPSVTGVSSATSINAPSVFISVQQDNRIATGNVGNVTPQLNFPITAKTATGSVGTVIYNVITYQTATGVTATGSVNSMVFSRAKFLTGSTVTATLGSVTPNPRLSLTQNTATGSVGTMPTFYWTQINTAQTPNWAQINNTQTPSWAVINTP